MRLIFFDIEIYPNYFLVLFYDPYIKEHYSFQLWTNNDIVLINDLESLKSFLKKESDTYFVGYNSLGYDMNILTAIIKKDLSSNEQIKAFNDHLIEETWPVYREEQLCNKTLDLMLINNFGPRSAKSTSLKKLEFNLRKKKIADLPYHFNDIIDTAIKVEEIIKYCKYDVEVTLDVFRLSKELIKMRVEFGNFNNIDLLNSPEPDIAKKYILKLLSTLTNKKEDVINKEKTYRDEIVVKDIILPYVSNYEWHNKEFKDVVDFYNDILLKPTLKSNKDASKKLINLKNTINKTFKFIDNDFVYAGGGLHSANKPGIYLADDEYIIMDSDVAAMYPTIAIKNNLYPLHLGEYYCDAMNGIVKERKKFSKKEYPHINYLLKICANSGYGSSNSEYKFFYDPQYTLQTCVNGMLTLTILIDKCVARIKDFTLIQANTDGISIRIKKEDEQLYLNIIKEVEQLTQLEFENVYYSKFVLRDVNNYISQYTNGDVKSKGVFEDYNDIINAGAFQKDTSAMIIPKALKAYYIEGIPVENTINKENSIYEFCYGNKGSNSYRWMLTTYNPDKGVSTSELFDSRFVRYYAGGYQTLSQLWVKGARPGTIQATQAQTPITLLMNVPKEDILDLDRRGEWKPRYDRENNIIYRYPNLNKNWYIQECYKIINQIQNK